eukprot:TRINITY_DN1894_c0_g1_i2.p1 TRINITY_DN1894_c0_g1~~TRINITY_DN1894_c0_g1_i2.p1  ORF type:complete len:282 (-),score=36.63 TRINITY_DN1894_c0_g1_i2:241-1086(-)
MYTNGQIKHIYPNGRIVYADQEFVNADGSVPEETQQQTKFADVEKRIAELEEQVEQGVPGAHKKLQEAEEELDQLLDQELLQDREYKKEKSAIKKSRNANQMDVEIDESVPPSFSQVDINSSPEIIKRTFPEFPKLQEAYVCEVAVGQMLYLPAGWFHEVKSFSVQDERELSYKGHMAFNFWFHPPDNLVKGEQGFSKPYTSNYWPQVWENRRHLYQLSLKPNTQTKQDRKRKASNKMKRVDKIRQQILLKSSVVKGLVIGGIRRHRLKQYLKLKRKKSSG